MKTTSIAAIITASVVASFRQAFPGLTNLALEHLGRVTGEDVSPLDVGGMTARAKSRVYAAGIFVSVRSAYPALAVGDNAPVLSDASNAAANNVVQALILQVESIEDQIADIADRPSCFAPSAE